MCHSCKNIFQVRSNKSSDWNIMFDTLNTTSSKIYSQSFMFVAHVSVCIKETILPENYLLVQIVKSKDRIIKKE